MSAPLPDRAEVVVAGGGPVGSAFALDLARRGVDVLVVEPEPRITFNGRARTISARAMEHLRALGVAEEMHEDSPVPADWYAGTSFRTSMAGVELLRTHPPEPGPRRRDSAERPHRLPQDRTNALLRAAGERAGVRLALGWAATGVRRTADARDDAVDLDVVDLHGTARTVRAGWVVAADGARSRVRRSLGVERDASPLLGHQHSVIVRVPGVFEATGTPPNAFNWIWNADVCDAFNPFEPDLYGMSIGPFPTDEPLTEDRIAHEVALRVGLRLPHETVTVTRYRLQKRVARTFVAGRVLLTGDAAHTFPPSLGMNLNTGLGDVANGAWKLAAVVRGWAPPDLLTSYDTERRPAAHAVGDASLAARATQDASLDHLRGRPVPEGDDEASRTERARIVEHLVGLRRRTQGADGVSLDLRYDDSPVVVPDGEPAAPWSRGTCTPLSRPGHRLPHAWLADGSPLFSLVGDGFTLLVRDDAPGPAAAGRPDVPGLPAATDRSGATVDDVARLSDAFASAGVPLSVVRLGGPRALPADHTARRLTLVRPDHHVAWHAARLDLPPERLVDVVRGAASRVTATT